MDTRVCFLVLTAICVSCRADTSANIEMLLNDLLRSYNKIAIPDVTGLNVSHSIMLQRITSMENQVLTLNTWIHLKWTDRRLMWDPEMYGGIEDVRIPAKMVWQPDIVLYNSAEPFNGYPGQDLNVVLSKDGNIWCAPQVQTKTYCACQKDVKKIKRKCECDLVFGSWTYNMNLIDLYPTVDSVDTSTIKPNPVWKYKGGSVERKVLTYECCPEGYVNLIYTVSIKNMDVDEQEYLENSKKMT